jgi:hypothetical protein
VRFQITRLNIVFVVFVINVGGNVVVVFFFVVVVVDVGVGICLLLTPFLLLFLLVIHFFPLPFNFLLLFDLLLALIQKRCG